MERDEVLWFSEDVGCSRDKFGDGRVKSDVCGFEVSTEKFV
jgi:hypothetical protein